MPDRTPPKTSPLLRSLARVGLAGAAVLALLGLQACSGTGGRVEHWEMVENRAPQPAPQASGTARQPVAVVFYRDTSSGTHTQNPINVYINGQYQASLVGSTYTEQALCPGNHRLMVVFNDVRQRYIGKDEGRTYAVGTQPVQYFRVSEDASGTAVIAPATREAAQSAGASLRELQVHTVPRVVRNGCAAS